MRATHILLAPRRQWKTLLAKVLRPMAAEKFTSQHNTSLTSPHSIRLNSPTSTVPCSHVFFVYETSAGVGYVMSKLFLLALSCSCPGLVGMYDAKSMPMNRKRQATSLALLGG